MRPPTLEQDADIIFLQEHSVEASAASKFKDAAKLKNWQCILGPVDPEHTRKSAGVGFLVRDGIRMIPITAATADYADAVNTGRGMIMQVETAIGYLYFANIYGWTGGTAGSVAAGRTNDLLTIILNELDLQAPGLILLGRGEGGTSTVSRYVSPPSTACWKLGRGMMQATPHSS